MNCATVNKLESKLVFHGSVFFVSKDFQKVQEETQV
jgi:hypothetical protein